MSAFGISRRDRFLNLDLLLLSRQFETVELPKEKKYLLRYFDNPVQEAFLKYFFVFDNYINFCDHTGYVVQKKWLKHLHEKLKTIEKAHKDARSNFDMAGLVEIEKGEFKFSRHLPK